MPKAARVARLSGRRCFLQTLAAFGGAGLAGLGSMAARAAPTPIRMIVPFAAGSSVDIVARLVIARASNHLGAPIIVENRAGAGGDVGATAAALRAPDGTNLFFGTAGTHGINTSLYKHLGYDPVKDFDPIIAISSSSNVMVVNPDLGIDTLASFVARAKAAPGSLTMGSNGIGTTPYLAGILFNRVAGIDTAAITYKSAAIMDVIAGRLTYSFESVPSAIPYIQSNKVHALAVTNDKREPMLEDVPTIAESGYPGYQVMAWAGLFAPKGSPSGFIQRINAATNQALRDPDIVKQLAALGSTPIGGTPDDLRQRVAFELKRWVDVIRDAHISID